MDRDATTTVQLKFRVKERLRSDLEQAARERGSSLNAEIVRRLERSFEQQRDPDELRDALYEAATQVLETLPELIAAGLDPAHVGQLAGIARSCLEVAKKDRIFAEPGRYELKLGGQK